MRLRSFRVTWAQELSPHILGMTGVQDSQACSLGLKAGGAAELRKAPLFLGGMRSL